MQGTKQNRLQFVVHCIAVLYSTMQLVDTEVQFTEVQLTHLSATYFFPFGGYRTDMNG
jgi:hypothetical protein